MAISKLLRIALCATLTVGAVAAATPASADDGWYWRERQERREQAWREQAWREQAWREHEWRRHEWRERHAWEHRYPPPVYGYPAPPRPYDGGPGAYR